MVSTFPNTELDGFLRSSLTHALIPVLKKAAALSGEKYSIFFTLHKVPALCCFGYFVNERIS